MKKMIRIMISGVFAIMLVTQSAFAQQKFDDDRMQRDIQVAENVLLTLIKQQFTSVRGFFPVDVKGTYQAGYGVTFLVPGDHAIPMLVGNSDVIVMEGTTFSRSYGRADEERAAKIASESDAAAKDKLKEKDKEKEKDKKRSSVDSLKNVYNQKVIEAARLFILDYGDMITQLGPNERIVITNRGSQARMWNYYGSAKRTHLSIEGVKSDITQYRQGKADRNQTLSKLKVVNTETTDAIEPDLELLASIFNRLYNQDLSKTYFTENSTYFERLKDFGVIYYMQVFSSNEKSSKAGEKRYLMPTQGLDDIDQATRNKKAVEMYPKFEQDIKENIIEYGRTLRSLKDEEVLIFQVTLTKCVGCGIPGYVEYSVKGSVLKDFNAGKIDKNGAVAKISLKKGPNQ